MSSFIAPRRGAIKGTGLFNDGNFMRFALCLQLAISAVVADEPQSEGHLVVRKSSPADADLPDGR